MAAKKPVSSITTERHKAAARPRKRRMATDAGAGKDDPPRKPRAKKAVASPPQSGMDGELNGDDHLNLLDHAPALARVAQQLAEENKALAAALAPLAELGRAVAGGAGDPRDIKVPVSGALLIAAAEALDAGRVLS